MKFKQFLFHNIDENVRIIYKITSTIQTESENKGNAHLHEKSSNTASASLVKLTTASQIFI